MKKRNVFYKVVLEIVDVFGKEVIIDKNCGSVEEIDTLLEGNLNKYPQGKWEIYPMYCIY